ncbi:MAG TPA: ABC transporter permease [Chitinophagales bacterium]|nr:ABC transporter permease [Chitinophagales bacterium]
MAKLYTILIGKNIYFDPMARQLYKTLSPKNYSALSYLKNVWQSRILIFTFAKRDLQIQYAQTYLGVLWAIIQPLTGLLIFSFFFQRLMPLQLGVPYPVFVFTGMMGWFYFTQLVGQAGTSLMNNQNLIKKIHFPRLVLPLSKMIVGLVEFCISLSLLLILMFVTGCPFSLKILLLPLVVIANVVTGLSIGIWLCALTIRFRDFHHLIPYLVGFGIWLTPVFYPTTIIPAQLNWVYYLHPVANVISLYRWIFIGWPVDLGQVAVSFSISLVLFTTGLLFFIRNEKHIADY